MHQRTKDYLMSMSKEDIIGYVDGIIKKRDEKEKHLIEENKILKDKIAIIQKIIGENTPQTLVTVIGDKLCVR